MWHWQNNGPRPPWTPQQIFSVLMIAWIAKCFTSIAQDTLTDLCRAIFDLVRP
jgi:hypothetical protein